MPVLTTSTSMTEAGKDSKPEALEESKLQRIPYIHYPAQFAEFPIEVFINLGGKINAIQPSFAGKLSLRICKIDSIRLETFERVIAMF